LSHYDTANVQSTDYQLVWSENTIACLSS